jgi:hypothetical protein
VNCFVCRDEPALAICGRCGAGLCGQHLHETDETLFVTMPINRRVPVEPAARGIRCDRCHVAEQAQRDKQR